MTARASFGAVREGEALAAPGTPACGDRAGTWGGIQRHKRVRQARCDTCRQFANDYSRQWYREARAIPAFRERHNEMTRINQRRRRQDPRYRAADNARARQRQVAQQERNRHDRLHAIDPVVVARLIAGEPATPNRVERLEAVRQLRDKGISYPQIAVRLRVAARQVHRDLTDLGLRGKDAVA